GSGAMGVVYGAYDPELDRRIAVKLLDGAVGSQEASARARLVREAKATARLAHPNVIAVHDVGVFEGRVFLAMEFLGGGTLRSWLSAAPRGWREVLEVFIAAGRGLLAAHRAGLVYRDFKPENVLLDRDGRPRVVDFGLAREAGDHGSNPGMVRAALLEAPSSVRNRLDTLTGTGTVMGTPAYMAPEQFLDEPTDERTDQFSFCVALYEALYGARPFGGDSVMQLLDNVTSGTPQPVPEDRDVPAWVRRAVMRGLAAEPGRRWPSMAPLIAALGNDPAVRNRRWAVAGVVVALVGATAAAGIAVVRDHHRELERQIGRRVRDAALASRIGQAKDAEVRALRQRAFDAFDAFDRARGEELWRDALAQVSTADGAYERAE